VEDADDFYGRAGDVTACLARLVDVGSVTRDEAVALALASASRDLTGQNAALSLALAAESMAATPSPLRQAMDALVNAHVALDLSPAQRLGLSFRTSRRRYPPPLGGISREGPGRCWSAGRVMEQRDRVRVRLRRGLRAVAAEPLVP
jgi:hypothetical protein